MSKQPTYTAAEIKQMCCTYDPETFRVIKEVLEDEIDLYGEEDLAILVQASMVMFIRALLAINFIKPSTRKNEETKEK